jgi:hemerythrin
MPLINWTDKLSVGVKDIDNQHKKLVGFINLLNDGIRTGKQ